MRSPKTKSVISLWLALAALLTLPAASGADTFYVSNLGNTIEKFQRVASAPYSPTPA